MEELSKKINVQNKVKIARQGAKPKHWSPLWKGDKSNL